MSLPRRLKYVSFAHEMSRGQAQRAMLAAALLSLPRMLIADEPLSGLDVTVARAVLGLIDDMRRERGMGLLLVTHDLGVVAAVADRVAVVYGGLVVEEAPAAALYRSPRHPYTDGLLGSVPGFTRGTAAPHPRRPSRVVGPAARMPLRPALSLRRGRLPCRAAAAPASGGIARRLLASGGIGAHRHRGVACFFA